MTNKIIEALLTLDVKNDNFWTADGLPRLDTIKMLVSDQSLTRDMVTAAAPGFSRTTATGYKVPQPQGPGGNTGTVPIAAPVAPAAPQTAEQVEGQHPAMEKASEGVSDIIAVLEASLAEQEELVSKIRAHKAEVDAAFEQARKKEDELRIKLEEARPQRSTGNDIQSYLAAQCKTLEARAARQQIIRESGINLKELASNLKAPIDAARTRRTTPEAK